MAELWRELIERDCPDLAGGLSLSRVSISKKTGRMMVQLCSERILTRSEFKRVQASLAAAFPTVEVKLQLRYPALKEAVRADVGRATRLLKDLLSHDCPGAVHFLDSRSAWQLEGDTLTVNVASSEGAEYLRMQGVDRMLQELFKRLFDLPVKVQLKRTGDDERRIQEINAARAKEAEMLAMDTAKNLEGDRKKSAPPP